MLTIAPLAILLTVALIYLLYLGFQIWRIHSAQRVVERNHRLTSSEFQRHHQDMYRVMMRHYQFHASIVAWIAVCCVCELSLGTHSGWIFLDYCILLAGCVGAAGICLLFSEKKEAEEGLQYALHQANPPRNISLWIISFCSLFAFQWELAAVAIVCGLAWIHSPYAAQEI